MVESLLWIKITSLIYPKLPLGLWGVLKTLNYQKLSIAHWQKAIQSKEHQKNLDKLDAAW
jgi:hypothetical protein